MNSREKELVLRAKKEGESIKYPSRITSNYSSRQWSSHKNPRIVRVSRSFGGKDRHSKVCTVRGLRDRRIRLSVQTAVQLYDLQHRLGLSQPSKVIDWLLDVTKKDIDKLPPLPIIPGTSNFTHFHQLLPPSNPQSHFLHNPKITKEQEQERENQEGFVAQLSAQNLFPLNNQSSFPNFPLINSYFQWDPPSLSLSHIGGGFPLSNQTDQDHSQINLSTILNSNSHLYPSATTIPSIIPSFPSYITPTMDNDWRQMNNLHQNPLLPTTLHLNISSPMKSFTVNVNSKSIHSLQNDNERRGKDHERSA